MGDATGTPENMPVAQDKRCRVDDLHSALVAVKEIVKEMDEMIQIVVEMQIVMMVMRGPK